MFIMKDMLKINSCLFVVVLCVFFILMGSVEAASYPKYTQQHNIKPRDVHDLASVIGAKSENDDLQGSSSFGYGYYSYPYLAGGYYSGHYPSYGGIYGLGYPYYGGYFGGYHDFHGNYW